MQDVVALHTDPVQSSNEPRLEHPLVVTVRAWGTQRGGLAEHIEEGIEAALRTLGAEPPGTWSGGADGLSFDEDEDARLSDQLFRARRIGADGMAIRLVALRALCAPVGGLDAADARTVAFYARASEDRPVVLTIDEADRALPAFVIAKPLADVIRPEPEPEPEVSIEESPSVSLATVVAAAPEPEPMPEPEPTPEPEPIFAEPSAADDRWREYVATLAAARGPQTLASFERLFVQSYLPLASVVDAGLSDRSAVETRDEFRRTFARAYADALPTFVLTGKRPRMVLDAFDVAAKIARAQSARAVQILLVDGMRFDLGARVAERTAELCEGRATRLDRVTLFSALPSATPRQLEGLARGIEALRSPEGDRDPEPMRGRTADAVRRVRIGSRDLYKLDLVETTLAAADDHAIDVLDDLAEDTARAVAKHIRAQSGRTLLFVLGDHGFRFEHGAAKHGGASPEEVIVAGHAFLVGDLH